MTTTRNSPSLGDRMKAYENAFNITLTKRTPVIIRLDMKSGHTWTKQLNRPFDEQMPNIMKQTVKYLVNNIQGCVFAYSQSDEISLFLRDYDSVNTESWFGSYLQKMVSVSASLATAKFNEIATNQGLSLALFDSRAFLLPKEEVVNYFIYRQHDGIRNSVLMYGQSIFGHKEMMNKSVNDVKQMLIDDGKPWDNVKDVFKYGFAYTKGDANINDTVPLFKEDRMYIEKLVYLNKD